VGESIGGTISRGGVASVGSASLMLDGLLTTTGGTFTDGRELCVWAMT
jgi:hypothetical protein